MAVVPPTVAKKLVDSLQTDLRTLSADCRRKYPPVKEVRLTDVTGLTPYCGCVTVIVQQRQQVNNAMINNKLSKLVIQPFPDQEIHVIDFELNVCCKS